MQRDEDGVESVALACASFDEREAVRQVVVFVFEENDLARIDGRLCRRAICGGNAPAEKGILGDALRDGAEFLRNAHEGCLDHEKENMRIEL